MKRLILLLLTLFIALLSACGSGVPGGGTSSIEPAVSDMTSVTDDSSVAETPSEPDTPSEPETPSESDPSSEPEVSSEHDTTSEDESSNPHNIPTDPDHIFTYEETLNWTDIESIKLDGCDFKNEDAENTRGDKVQDYCTCGTTDISGYRYPLRINSLGTIVDYAIEQGLFEGFNEAVDFFEQHRDEYHESLPGCYVFIKLIGMTKEEYLVHRDRVIALHYARGWEHDIPDVYTDREIEIIFGDYDEETVIKELKDESAYYFEGHLYSIEELAYVVDDETFARMWEEDDFRLYYYDVKFYALSIGIHGFSGLQQRVEALSSGNE